MYGSFCFPWEGRKEFSFDCLVFINYLLCINSHRELIEGLIFLVALGDLIVERVLIIILVDFFFFTVENFYILLRFFELYYLLLLDFLA